MQVVEQRVNRCDVDFFCSELGFGRPGERELLSFKTEFKENVICFQSLSKLFVGTCEDLSSLLELALFKTITLEACFRFPN